MSTPLHVFLKVDPSLEGDETYDKVDSSACNQLAGYLSYSIFGRSLAPWTTNICLDRLDFLEKFLPQWLHYSGKQGRVGSGR